MATFKPNPQGEQQLFHSNMVSVGVKHHAEQLLDIAKQEVPVASGALRESGKVDKLFFGYRVVFGGPQAPYAQIVHDGRGPIFAKPGKVLRFEINGKVIYTKRVGPAKGNPWLWRAVVRYRGAK